MAELNEGDLDPFKPPHLPHPCARQKTKTEDFILKLLPSLEPLDHVSYIGWRHGMARPCLQAAGTAEHPTGPRILLCLRASAACLCTPVGRGVGKRTQPPHPPHSTSGPAPFTNSLTQYVPQGEKNLCFWMSPLAGHRSFPAQHGTWSAELSIQGLKSCGCHGT